jgi:hypothetical protein
MIIQLNPEKIHGKGNVKQTLEDKEEKKSTPEYNSTTDKELIIYCKIKVTTLEWNRTRTLKKQQMVKEMD